MNTLALKSAGRYLAVWGAIVLCVLGVSLVFTFLATLACAALVGMMMGAFKGPRWFAGAVSLAFPGVMFAMVCGASLNLTPQQVILLVALGFSVFWVSYFVSAFLFFCEQKGGSSPRPLAPAPHASTPTPDSCLEQLQGNWVREVPGAGAPVCRSVIQIKEAKLELKAIDGGGRITLLATGDVTLQNLRPT